MTRERERETEKEKRDRQTERDKERQRETERQTAVHCSSYVQSFRNFFVKLRMCFGNLRLQVSCSTTESADDIHATVLNTRSSCFQVFYRTVI